MANADTLTVYWAPANYRADISTIHLAYRKPESLLSFIHGNKMPTGQMQSCPAMRNRLDNVFVFKSSFTEEFDFGLKGDLQFDTNRDPREMQFVEADTGVGLYKPRPPQLKGYNDLAYNLAWCLWASEPVMARFTAPYYPPTTPMEGALLAPGEFDIGRWYRPFILDYHVPYTTTHFKVKENDPLFFLELETDKKVEFKRYEFSVELGALAQENAQAHERYAKNTPLEKRYEQAEEAMQPELVMKYIRDNLVE